MKKIFFVIAAIVVSLLLHSCGNDYNDVLEIDNSIIQTRALNVDSIDKGEIIPVPESPHKRKDLSLVMEILRQKRPLKILILLLRPAK